MDIHPPPPFSDRKNVEQMMFHGNKPCFWVQLDQPRDSKHHNQLWVPNHPIAVKWEAKNDEAMTMQSLPVQRKLHPPPGWTKTSSQC